MKDWIFVMCWQCDMNFIALIRLITRFFLNFLLISGIIDCSLGESYDDFSGFHWFIKILFLFCDKLYETTLWLKTILHIIFYRIVQCTYGVITTYNNKLFHCFFKQFLNTPKWGSSKVINYLDSSK